MEGVLRMFQIFARMASFLFFFSSMAIWAGGSKAPGPGSFEYLSLVTANPETVLRRDNKEGDLIPLNQPKKVAFTKVKDANDERTDSIMILRNNKSKNFRFDLPDTVGLANLDRPVSYNPAAKLSEVGDVLTVAPGMGGTEQNLGLRVSFDDEYDNSYSYETTESCTITEQRRRRVRHCWRDSHGYRHCDYYWEEWTEYIQGRRDATRYVNDEGYIYNLELFDASGAEQMRARVEYSDSSSYTVGYGPCMYR
jgi:hypothetical protein